MKRVIQFSKARYLFFGFSSILIIIGIVGFIINHGFNLGVDFEAGIAFQYRVAPASFSMQYQGPDKAIVSIPAGERALTSAGNLIISITSSKDGSTKDYPFRYTDYKTVQDLADAITKVPGMTVQPKGDMTALPTQLLALPRPADITGHVFLHQHSAGTRQGRSDIHCRDADRAGPPRTVRVAGGRRAGQPGVHGTSARKSAGPIVPGNRAAGGHESS